MEANDLPFFHLCASHFEFPCHRHSYFTLVWKERPFVHILNSTLAKKVAKLLPFSSWYYACVAWAAKRGT